MQDRIKENSCTKDGIFLLATKLETKNKNTCFSFLLVVCVK